MQQDLLGIPTIAGIRTYSRQVAEVEVRKRLAADLPWVAALGLTLLSVQNVQGTRWGVDAHAYWDVWRGSMYAHPPNAVDAYLYSPAFSQLMWPLSHLPWPVFGTMWCLGAATAYAYLFWPLGWRRAFPLVLCCSPDILIGNVFWIFALVAVKGLRWPALWAFPALTKITPAVGPVWFLARREWRNLAVSSLATAGVVAVSAAVVPDLWADWVRFLASNHGQGSAAVSFLVPPLTYRLPVALIVAVWTARTDRRWGLPVAMLLATPVFAPAAFAVLAAIPRLAHPDSERSSMRQVSTVQAPSRGA